VPSPTSYESTIPSSSRSVSTRSSRGNASVTPHRRRASARHAPDHHRPHIHVKLVDESCRETRVDDFTAALDHQPVDAPLCQRVDSRHEVDVVPVALALTFGPASALDHDDLDHAPHRAQAPRVARGRRRGDEQVGRRRVVEDPGVGRRPSGRVDDDAGGLPGRPFRSRSTRRSSSSSVRCGSSARTVPTRLTPRPRPP